MDHELLLQKYLEPTQVLDKGHVQLIDVMGDDTRIESAARLSYQKGTRRVSDTRKLLRYLMRRKHWSPFEKCVIEIDIKMPIFVARQFVRHRTQSINEVSGRYSVLLSESYTPDIENILYQNFDNKQGGAAPFPPNEAEQLRNQMIEHDRDAFAQYDQFIDAGMAREMARINLPLTTYTRWNTTMNLRNLFGFLLLRLDPHAQYEARMYANAIWTIVKDWVPLAAEAFEDYELYAVTFSRQEMVSIRKVLLEYAKIKVALGTEVAEHGATEHAVLLSLVADLPTREQNDFLKKLGI